MKNPVQLIVIIVIALALAVPMAAFAGDAKCTLNMDIKNPLFGITADVEGPISMEDAGCALLKRSELCGAEILEFEASAIAQDYLSGESISFAEAFFVMDAGIDTPQGTGIVTFRERSSAESFVKDAGHGKVLIYNEIIDVSINIK